MTGSIQRVSLRLSDMPVRKQPDCETGRPEIAWTVPSGPGRAAEAIALQKRWAGLVRQKRLDRPVRLVGGADVAFSSDGPRCIAAAVLMDYRTGVVLETAAAERALEFAYIPGLLSFREAPAVLAAVEKLSARPDVLLVDGQGLAHPRRFGLASHLGVALGLPTIGCAKSRLIGTHRQVGGRKGNRCQLKDGDEVIGSVVRTRDDIKCVYVSVGHLVTLAEAIRIVLACCGRYRLCEPIRHAHRHVTQLRRRQ